MSEPASKFDQYGFDRDPFAGTIASRETAMQYAIVGRDEEEAKLQTFVEDGVRSPLDTKRGFLFGDYGTGKSHHLIQLRDDIADGVEVDGEEYEAIPVHLPNLGLSIRHIYEQIVDEIKASAPELSDYIDSLDDVEPETSVEETYRKEKLRDNIAENLRRVTQTAINDYDYRAVFLLIDEAEDIENAADDEPVEPFIRSFLHIVNELDASGMHMLLGISRKAYKNIIDYEEDNIGNALAQRFNEWVVYLGDLREDDVKTMLIDRMEHHRSTNTGRLDPIVDETVSVVTRVTGGHPREILAIYSQALNYAAELSLDMVNGEAVVHAMTGFQSFVRDEERLSGGALTALQSAIGSASQTARENFERLQGRLIGEDEAVPESTLDSETIQTLLSSITVEEDEIRVLNEVGTHGRREFCLSDNVKDFLFGRTGGSTTKVQDLHLRAQSAPEKFQRLLSRGLGLALQQIGYGNLHRSPLTTQLGNNDFHVYLIDVNREAGKRNQTVAISVYNGQEVPKELVKLHVEALQDHKANFALLLRNSSQLSAEAHKFVHELDEHSRELYDQRMLCLNFDPEHLDEYVFGRLAALGDPDEPVDETDTEPILNDLEIKEQFGSVFEDVLLAYPDDTGRTVVNCISRNPSRDYTITEIREEEELKDYQLNTQIMSGYADQGLVTKSGKRWTYPDVESDRPPWYEVYRVLKQADTGLTKVEIAKELQSRFVLDCASGDELALIEWYLDQLRQQGYVSISAEMWDGSEIDVAQVISVDNRFNDALDDAKDHLSRARGLYDEAVQLDVENSNDFNNTIEDLEERYSTHEGNFDPAHGALNELSALIDDIRETEEAIEDAVSSRQETLVGRAKNLIQVETQDLLDEIENADIEGAYRERVTAIKDQVTDLQDELSGLIEQDSYQQLNNRLDGMESTLEDLEGRLDKLLGDKQRCIDTYDTVTDIRDAAKAKIEELSGRNSRRDEFVNRLDELDATRRQYEAEFDSGQYEAALEILTSEAKSQAQRLKSDVDEVHSDQQAYESQLSSLETEVQGESEASELLQEAKEAVATGNFARVPGLIDNIKDHLEGPTQRELFEGALKAQGGSVTDAAAEADIDLQRALEYVWDMYGDGVSDITVVFRS